MAGATASAVEIFPCGHIPNVRGIRITLYIYWTLLPVVQPAAHLRSQEIRVLEGRAFYPTAGALIADDNTDVVVIGTLVLDILDIQTQLLADQYDFLLLPRQE